MDRDKPILVSAQITTRNSRLNLLLPRHWIGRSAAGGQLAIHRQWKSSTKRLLKETSLNKMAGRRTKPNILVTGTPGTGKTTTARALAESTGLRHANVGDLAKEKRLYDGYDHQLDCHILNEDLVCDELEDIMDEGGVIVDYHGCDFFPEHWFDLVVVLQTDNTVLYDRLSARGYTGLKLTNNMECEIMEVLLEEARESYEKVTVAALRNDSVDDMNRNLRNLTGWVSIWRP